MNILYRWVSHQVDPRPLGLARIGVGVAFILDWFNKVNRREGSFDPDLFHYPWANWLPVLPPEYSYLPFILWFIGGLGLIVGYQTRISGAIALFGNSLYFFADRQNYSNHGYLLLLIIFLLTLADSGAALSLDARHRQPRLVAGWVVDLLKIQLSTVYFYTFLVKLRPDWLSGALMYLNLNGPIAPFLTQLPGIYRGLAGLTLLVEGFLFWALWSKWREWAFLVGLLLHLGILLSVKFTLGLISFSLLSVSLYPLFIKLPQDKVTVSLHNDSDRPSLWLLRRLDWLKVIDLQIASDADTSWLTVTEPNGRKRYGNRALSRWLALLPLTAPISPLVQLNLFQKSRGEKVISNE
ncbi:MAG: HTTM domain-containing protein [Cyanobacteria bacterium J06607_15]